MRLVVTHPLFIPSYTGSWVGRDSSHPAREPTGLCTLSSLPELFNHILERSMDFCQDLNPHIR